VAFYSLEPFGPLRDDLRAATVAAAAGSAFGAKCRPADFFETLKAEARLGRAGGGVAGWLALAPAGAAVLKRLRRGD
jgi:hypothetical protein